MNSEHTTSHDQSDRVRRTFHCKFTLIPFAECMLLQYKVITIALSLAVSVQGITEVGMLEVKRVQGPAELQIAKYCMRNTKKMRNLSSLLYLRSFMPMATCKVVGSELQWAVLVLMPLSQRCFADCQDLLCQNGLQHLMCMQIWCCVLRIVLMCNPFRVHRHALECKLGA